MSSMLLKMKNAFVLISVQCAMLALGSEWLFVDFYYWLLAVSVKEGREFKASCSVVNVTSYLN